MKYIAAFLTVFSLSCAHLDLKPAGELLNKTRATLVAVDKSVAVAQALVEAVCAPAVVTPAAVNMCGGAYDVLSEADHAQDIAREAFVVAQAAYSAINADADAGAP